MADYKVKFGGNCKPTSYDGLSVGQRRKLQRYNERKRRADLLKRIGESNLRNDDLDSTITGRY